MTIASPESSDTDKGSKNMKKTISLFLVIISVLCFSVSCSDTKEEKPLEKFTMSEDGSIKGEGGAVYKCAPIGYEPVSQGKEYAILEITLPEKLYMIPGLDANKWLTTECVGNFTQIYYSPEITLPTLENMGAETLYLCDVGANTIALSSLGGENAKDRDRDRAIINELISLLLDEGKENQIWPRMDSNETYSLKLSSPKWPEIYYSLEYAICDSGHYVYDKVNKRCVEIGDLLDAVFNSQ